MYYLNQLYPARIAKTLRKIELFNRQGRPWYFYFGKRMPKRNEEEGHFDTLLEDMAGPAAPA